MTLNATEDAIASHWRNNVETQVGAEARLAAKHFQNIAAGIGQIAQGSDASMRYRSKLIRAYNAIREVVNLEEGS